MKHLTAVALAGLIATPAAAGLPEDVELVGQSYGTFRACTAYYAERGGLDALSFRVPREDRNRKALDAPGIPDADRETLVAAYETARERAAAVALNRIRILRLQAEVRDSDDGVLDYCSAAAGTCRTLPGERKRRRLLPGLRRSDQGVGEGLAPAQLPVG
ncbi:MAG: hypothetical protein ACMVY4_11635 [Minwuia sp.]|uniref:hypothetical protein n=1 Tax=Minwuia sp. TaxID=2493630 RepID=UPI003A8382A1